MGLAETYKQSQGGRTFFKPKDYADAKAFLIEYKGYDPDHKGYQDKVKPAVKVDITVFNDDLTVAENGVFTNQYLEQGAIVGFLKTKTVGDVFIKKLTQLESKNGNNPAWAFNGVDDEETFKAVAKYYDEREAQIAEALSGDDLPPWLVDSKKEEEAA